MALIRKDSENGSGDEPKEKEKTKFAGEIVKKWKTRSRVKEGNFGKGLVLCIHELSSPFLSCLSLADLCMGLCDFELQCSTFSVACC